MVECDRTNPRHYLGRYLRFQFVAVQRDTATRNETQWKAHGAVEMQLMSGGIVTPAESVELDDWITTWGFDV